MRSWLVDPGKGCEATQLGKETSSFGLFHRCESRVMLRSVYATDPRPITKGGDDRMTTDIAPRAGAMQGIDEARAEAEGVIVADLPGLVSELSDEVRQLKEALDSNRRIGMAMGLVMGQLHVTDAEAFDALRRISQNTNRKLRDVADDVIYHHGL